MLCPLKPSILGFSFFSVRLYYILFVCVVHFHGWMADEERDRIQKRQREGIDVALQNGTVLGRPKVTEF